MILLARLAVLILHVAQMPKPIAIGGLAVSGRVRAA
jgi:hypothetical protein